MSFISFEIKEKIGILSETSSGWTKELRRIDWNGRGDKYDIREWSPDQRKMSRGVTLSLRETLALKEMLEMIRLDLELELEEGEGRREKAFGKGPEADLAPTAGEYGDNGGLSADAGYVALENGGEEEESALQEQYVREAALPPAEAASEVKATDVSWKADGAGCHTGALAV